jgi:hypothetical protein
LLGIEVQTISIEWVNPTFRSHLIAELSPVKMAWRNFGGQERNDRRESKRAIKNGSAIRLKDSSLMDW